MQESLCTWEKRAMWRVHLTVFINWSMVLTLDRELKFLIMRSPFVFRTDSNILLLSWAGNLKFETRNLMSLLFMVLFINELIVISARTKASIALHKYLQIIYSINIVFVLITIPKMYYSANFSFSSFLMSCWVGNRLFEVKSLQRITRTTYKRACSSLHGFVSRRVGIF